MDLRRQKALQLLKNGKIKKLKDGFAVQSQNSQRYYFVDKGYSCTCPDCQLNKTPVCKHSQAVKYYLGIEKADGTTEKVRLTYKQAWSAYNQAQNSEIKQFEILLSNLLECVNEPTRNGAGRPSLSLREALFCSVKKVYSQMSSRRAKGLFNEAKEKEIIKKSPHFNAVSKLLNKEKTTKMLEELVSLSATPLRNIEHTWLADSSGFRTNSYSQYCQEKHGKSRENNWLKMHIVCGQKTNVISSVKITKSHGVGSGDCPQFIPMMEQTHQAGFTIGTAMADKAYLSRENYSLIDSFCGEALIPFKNNSTGKPRGKGQIWRKMFNYFQLNQEEFMQRYFARNNVETTFHMIKSKLGDSIKSKNFVAQKNELLCKVLAHNIMVLIQEVHELGITAQFPILNAEKGVKETCTFIQTPAPLFTQK